MTIPFLVCSPCLFDWFTEFLEGPPLVVLLVCPLRYTYQGHYNQIKSTFNQCVLVRDAIPPPTNHRPELWVWWSSGIWNSRGSGFWELYRVVLRPQLSGDAVYCHLSLCNNNRRTAAGIHMHFCSCRPATRDGQKAVEQPPHLHFMDVVNPWIAMNGNALVGICRNTVPSRTWTADGLL